MADYDFAADRMTERMVEIAALRDENEDLKRLVESYREALHAIADERDQYRAQAAR